MDIPLCLLDSAQATSRQVTTSVDIGVLPTRHSTTSSSKLGSETTFTSEQSDSELKLDREGRIVRLSERDERGRRGESARGASSEVSRGCAELRGEGEVGDRGGMREGEVELGEGSGESDADG